MSASGAADVGPSYADVVQAGPKAVARKASSAHNTWHLMSSIVALGFCIGYFLGFAAKDTLFENRIDALLERELLHSDQSASSNSPGLVGEAATSQPREWPGDTIHTVLTSSGDGYQNFQTRIMYETYKLVQKMPGGEKMTGFTRILHRTVPDILMDVVPTFHVWDVLKPQCDGWCDYPVANRPNAIAQYFQAVAKNHSLVKGAWIFMAECDYVWMTPLKPPGSAYDRSVPRQQYHFDYINPNWPNNLKHLRKLIGEKFDTQKIDIPASGPAPVLMSLDDWLAVLPDYERASAVMEKDPDMVKDLGWVREMYAWDAAIAMHTEIKMLTEKPPNSILMVQPPFDEGMFNASMCHYTWGALYSDNGKEVYRWEKRDYTDPKHVIHMPKIPMPIPFRKGLKLEFDAELTEPRHNLVVAYLGMLNKGIENCRDLDKEAAELDGKIAAWKSSLPQRMGVSLASANIKYLHFD